jgi:hypothetical protein
LRLGQSIELYYCYKTIIYKLDIIWKVAISFMTNAREPGDNHRAARMRGSGISELLKLLEKSDVIFFAGSRVIRPD